jgi:hypothetical protein
MDHYPSPLSLSSLAAKILRATFGPSAITGWALALTVLGWTLTWAAALGLMNFVPIAAAVAIFVLGLALIPFGIRQSQQKVTQPRSPAVLFDRSTVPS